MLWVPAHTPGERQPVVSTQLARRATLRDVAVLAGVSTKTASRVVNGETGVVAAKVAAVHQAIVQLDYRRDMTASSLRRADGRTAALAAILEDLANPFSAEVHRALENVARDRGVLVFAGSVDEDPERERQLVQEFTSRRADGLIMMPASHHHGYLERELRGTPVVFVDRPPTGFTADAVLTDNNAGVRRGIGHLIDVGHRRIAFLGDQLSIATARERHTGYLEAMSDAGLAAPSRMIATGLHGTGTAEAAVRAILETAEPPTALFTAQNNITIAALRVLHQLGLSQRIALVGFDDLAFADLVEPGVTVMAQDPQAMGRCAAERLFERLAGDDSPARTDIIPTRLLTRGSGEISPTDG